MSHANNIPPSAPLKVAGDAAADWECFKCEFESYEIATDLVDCDDKKRAAVFLACIASAAHAIFRTFKIESDDDRAKVDKIKESFDKYFLGKVNVTYERYVFHQRVQQQENMSKILSRTCVSWPSRALSNNWKTH